MKRFDTRIVVCAMVLFCCTSIASPTAAGIISNISGNIHLQLDPYWDHYPGPDQTPTTSQIADIPFGMKDVSASIDGSGYYTVGGLSEAQYDYTKLSKSRARLDIDTYADSEGRDDGGGGHTAVQLDVTFTSPVYYRFEADAESGSIFYEAGFNGESAYASYDAYFGGYYGTFPIKYYYEDGVPVIAYGWHTYILEGVLPAGTYRLTTQANAGIHGRYGVGLGSSGTASLYVQMLGDVNGNGRVGNEDLNLVLKHWGKTPNKHGKLIGDANGDGIVDQTDLDLVTLALDGQVAAPTRAVNIPEPASVTWSLIITLVLRRTRSIRSRA